MEHNIDGKMIRPRRLRASPLVRELVREIKIEAKDLIMPIFIKETLEKKVEIPSMPGIFQLSYDDLDEEIKTLETLGIKGCILFGIPKEKDKYGSYALKEDGVVQKALRKIKALNPKLLLIADLCFCEYTDHGHCGLLDKDGYLDNDLTLKMLSEQALSLAKAGADIIAPSGMLDHAVYTLRKALDSSGYLNIPIMSYSVKYASSMYGPFRQAAEGAPQFGDRKTYQMDYANSKEALKEARIDVEEGADFLMVKPAHTYLDIIYKVKQQHPSLPLVAYHTSGEYSMLKAAAYMGWIEENEAVLEILSAIKRSGADLIITYFAKQFVINKAS